jgi:hypothetical protein
VKLRRELQEKEARYRKIIGQLGYEVDWLGKKSGLKDQSCRTDGIV